MRSIALLAILLGLTGIARADWTGTGEAGLVVASGNTESKTANAKLAVEAKFAKWTHSAEFSDLYASSDGDKSAQRWDLSGESDYGMTAKTFVFGAVRYERDQFSGFRYQGTLSGGVGRHFIDTEPTKLTGTAGIGYKLFETRNAYDSAGNLIEGGDQDGEAVLRSTLDFQHDFNELTRFVNDSTVEAGSSNTFLENVSTLKTRMSEKLALALAYTIRYNTDPTAGFEKTDTLTTVNLVYEFK